MPWPPRLRTLAARRAPTAVPAAPRDGRPEPRGPRLLQGGAWFRNQLAEEDFFGAIRVVWAGFNADVVFCHLETFEQDEHNLEAVIEGYRSLIARHADVAVQVPRGSRAEITAFLLDQLEQRHLVDR